MTSTPLIIKAREIAGKVTTRGPWSVHRVRRGINGAQIVSDNGTIVARVPYVADRSITQKEADAELIAWSRTGVLDLADALEESEKELQSVTAAALKQFDNNIALKADVKRLTEALEFYRDNWKSKLNKQGTRPLAREVFEWSPNEALLDDCGTLADAALKDGQP